jgi:hypothetical protein
MNVVAVEAEHRIKGLRPSHFDAHPDAQPPVLEIDCLGRTLHTSRAAAPRALRADSATSATTGSAYFSTTAESTTITGHHGSEPALPAWWRRIRNPCRVVGFRIEFRLLGAGIHTGGVIASVPSLSAETSLYRESGQCWQPRSDRRLVQRRQRPSHAGAQLCENPPKRSSSLRRATTAVTPDRS